MRRVLVYDDIKPDLLEGGVHAVMFSGDDPRTVRAVAAELGLASARIWSATG
jgi:cation transport ATPase